MCSMQCPLCDCLSPSLKFYVSHLRTSYSKDPSFHIICGLNGSREVFLAFSAFNSHLYSRHRAEMEILSSKSQSSNEFEKADSLENVKEGENVYDHMNDTDQYIDLSNHAVPEEHDAERQWQSDTSDQQTPSFSQTDSS